MLAKMHAVLLPILLASAAARAEGEPQFPAGRNHLYFHPFVTAISLASDKLPLFLGLTYERLLSSPGNAFIWQPQLVLGDQKDGDVTVSQTTTAQYLGLRHYFGEGYRGFYAQGSAAGLFGSFDAEQKGNPNKASGTISGFGGYGYLGYKWDFVFFDVGGGYQGVNGTVKMDSGDEVEVAKSGPGIDINLGIGF